jgi:aspartate kinase
MILSQGEMLSSVIVYNALKKAGIKTTYVDARNIMKTDSNYTEAVVDFNKTGNEVDKIKDRLFLENDCIITGGFYGANENGAVTTLGRGGSDYSAAIFASALKADKLEIWTDVDGILTSDPRLIKDTKLILSLSYTEAAELAFFGAKVLHPKTIYPAVNSQIPVVVLNSFNPSNPGTNIIGIRSNIKMIKAIAFRKGVTVINVNSFRMLGAYGFLSKVFEIFNDFETPVDLVATSEVNVSMTIDDDKNLSFIIDELEKFANVNIQKRQAIISAVGEGIRDTAGIAGKFFSALAGININLVSIGASDVNLSIVVAEDDLEKAVILLHETFFKDINHPELFSSIN